ncbi:MAG: hypothetical protein FJ260_09595 [Planctomycetes bacterium]|nr:hypothetical protein [Planctomycetota bacterium]
MNPTSIAIPLAALIAHAAAAGLSLSGHIWGGGFPGPSQESFSAINSQGGSGGGTTAGGFGRAGMTVAVALAGEAASIHVTGSAQHPRGGNGHSSSYTRNPETFSPEGLLLTIDGESDFAITNNSFAIPFLSQFMSTGFFEITPARLTAVSGTITSTDGLSGRLSAGTYRLDLFISAFGFPSYLPEWAGYQSILDLGRGVQSASMSWTLSMTPVPAPGPLAVAVAAVSVKVLRRRSR